MPGPTSKDLHPTHGARFVFTRSTAEELAYGVAIYVEDGRTIRGELSWPEDQLEVRGEIPAGPLHDEVVKLARPLRSKGPSRMTRWRDIAPAS
jgi:hypothetical protein